MLRVGDGNPECNEGPCSQEDYKNAVRYSVQNGMQEAENLYKNFQDSTIQWIIDNPTYHLDELKKRLLNKKMAFIFLPYGVFVSSQLPSIHYHGITFIVK